MLIDPMPDVMTKPVRRLAPLYVDGPHADPVDVLDPAFVGLVLACLLNRDGAAVTMDEDGRRFIARQVDEDGSPAWRILGRIEGLPAAEAVVPLVVDALPVPNVEEHGRAVVDAHARTVALSVDQGRGWPAWRARVADEALYAMADRFPVLDFRDTVPPWRPTTGPRASTVASRGRAETHARLFLDSIPATLPLRSEVWRQYLTAAERSGVNPVHRLGKGDLFARLADRATVTRRAHGVVVAVPAPDLPTAEEKADRAEILACTRAALAARRPRPEEDTS